MSYADSSTTHHWFEGSLIRKPVLCTEGSLVREPVLNCSEGSLVRKPVLCSECSLGRELVLCSECSLVREPVLHTHFPPTHFPPPRKNENLLVFPPERSVYTHFLPWKDQNILIFPPWFLGGKSEFILKFPPHTQFSPFALIDYTTKYNFGLGDDHLILRGWAWKIFKINILTWSILKINILISKMKNFFF
jgi:hypothetical protein